MKGAASAPSDHLLGEYVGTTDGPLLIAIGGLHGNEPAGVHAAKRVLATLRARQPAMHGRFVAFVGNLTALDLGVRYVDSDLNRIWTRDAIERLPAADPAGDTGEERAQRAILNAIEARLADLGERRAIFLDMHSTSALGPPFAIIGDTLKNRAIAFAFGVPVILGLEENVHGTLLEYYGEQGHVAVGLEGGTHTDDATVDHHESALWITLVTAGLLDEASVPDLSEHRARLVRGADRHIHPAARKHGVPPVLEIVYRHEVRDSESFTMEPGFENFQPVETGRLLAGDGPGGSEEVRAEPGGILLMPRYQGQGRDGFFVTRPVRRFWLAVSAHIRRTGLEHLLPLLPGIRRRPGDPNSLIVDRHIARWYRRQIFHLLGYRRATEEPEVRVYSRRAE